MPKVKERRKFLETFGKNQRKSKHSLRAALRSLTDHEKDRAPRPLFPKRKKF